MTSNSNFKITDFLSYFPDSVIQFFDDTKKNKMLAETIPTFNADYVDRKQSQGCGIFYSPNGFVDGHRKTENLAKINSVFIDLDVTKEKINLPKETISELKQAALQTIEMFPLTPHFVIETKNGLQVIWLVKDFNTTKFDEVVDFLIEKFRADEGRKGVTGVLRMPGYLHLKNPNEPFLCTLIKDDPSLPKYKPGDFYNLPDFSNYIEEPAKQNQLFNEAPIEHNPSPEIQKALETPISEVIKIIAPVVGINIQLEKNSDGTNQIFENGERTSGFISKNKNFVHSSSNNGREGNPITVAEYYLNKVGGNTYNRQELAKIIIKQCAKEPTLITEENSHYSFITAGELIKLNLPAPEYLIEEILPDIGISLISALPNGYKTWMYIHFVSCIMKGLPVFGIYPTATTNVILINTDDSLREIRKRLKMARINDNQESKVIVWERRTFKITEERDREELKIITKKWNARLIIVDTLRHSHNEDENKSDVMDKVMVLFAEVSQACNCNILLIHHNSKEYAGRNSITAPSGSIVIMGKCISSLALKQCEQENQLSIVGGKNKIGPIFPKMILQFDPDAPGENMFRKIESKVPESIEEAKNDVLAVYTDNPNPKQTKDEFIKEYKKSHQLTTKGMIEKVFNQLTKEKHLGSRTGPNNRKEFYLVQEVIEKPGSSP